MVAERQEGAAYDNLSDLPVVHSASLRVKQHDLHVVDRFADRDRPRRDLDSVVDEELADEPALGRAESVHEDAPPSETTLEALDVALRCSIALKADDPQSVERLVSGEEVPKEGRHAVEHRRTPLGEPTWEGVCPLPVQVKREERRPVEESAEGGGDRRAEARRLDEAQSI